MASGASKLENELVAFVEGHPETFNHQDVVNLRRNIIASFALMEGIHNQDKPGVGGLARMIISHISETVQKKEINTSQDVQRALMQFELCVEIIDRFLTRLCGTERAHNIGGYTGNMTPHGVCGTIAESVQHPSAPHYADNVYSRVSRKINEYHAKVLKLWADVLVREGKITQKAIDETRAAGYEVKFGQLQEKCNTRTGAKSNLNESTLLAYLTLVHVTTSAQMLAHPNQLSLYVLTVISQFVPTNNEVGYSHVPQSNKHESELNMLHLTCVVVAKPHPSTQLPVLAYLSSDVLDQCVQSVGQFPTTDQFIQYLNTRMIEKAAAFSPKPPTAVELMRSRMLERRRLFESHHAIQAPPSESLRLSSAPPLNELDGGKKTRRKASQMRTKCKKNSRCRNCKHVCL